MLKSFIFPSTLSPSSHFSCQTRITIKFLAFFPDGFITRENSLSRCFSARDGVPKWCQGLYIKWESSWQKNTHAIWKRNICRTCQIFRMFRNTKQQRLSSRRRQSAGNYRKHDLMMIILSNLRMSTTRALEIPRIPSGINKLVCSYLFLKRFQSTRSYRIEKFSVGRQTSVKEEHLERLWISN